MWKFGQKRKQELKIYIFKRDVKKTEKNEIQFEFSFQGLQDNGFE